ncbi:MAG TPA: glycosyltransferase family 39 protein [Aggregatilineaceae bacterium]|nr:glycosyltransferase family 39 protein [Aggregatilineaceae bacterium]
MNKKLELWLVVLLLLLVALLRVWDLTCLPPGFTDDEITAIRMSENVRDGDVRVYYPIGGGGRAAMFSIFNTLSTSAVGDGLLGYRMLPVWCGLITLALLYRLARRLFDVRLALITLGLLAVNMRAIWLSRTVTAEAVVPLFVVLTLLTLVIAFNMRQEVYFRVPDTLPFVLLALLLGIGGYLHYSLLVLGPLVVLLFGHMMLTHQPVSRRMWNALFFVVILATVAALPYLISTAREPKTSEPYLLWAERPQSVGEGLDGLVQAVGGLLIQGDTNPARNLPEHPLLGPAVAVLFVIGLIDAGRKWRDPRYFLLLALLAAGVLTDAWIQPETTFSANLVALPAIGLLAGQGAISIGQALRGRGWQHAWQMMVLVLVAIGIANIVTVRNSLFEAWRTDAEITAAYHAQFGYLAQYLDRTADGLPVSMCSMSADDDELVDLMMHRDNLAIRHSDCQSGLVFINAGEKMRFVFAGLPDEKVIQKRLAQRPELVVGDDAVIPPDVLYDAAGMRPELADWMRDGEVVPVEGVPDGTVITVDVAERIADANGSVWSAVQVFFLPNANGKIDIASIPVTFEGNLTFAGYQLGGGRLPGDDGNPVVLISYWRVDGTLPENLQFYADIRRYHKHSESGENVPATDLGLNPQNNGINVEEAELQKRDVFAQVLFIPPYHNVEKGEYGLTLGVNVGNQPLNVLDREANGRARGNLLWLGSIWLETPLSALVQ